MAPILICGDNASIDNSTCVFAFINEPLWGEILTERLVWFDASELTFAMEYDPVAMKGNCIAGHCPSNYHDETPIENSPQGIDNLEFNWTLYDASCSPDYCTYKHTGMGNNGAYFNFTFGGSTTPEHPHKAHLRVTLIED